MTRTEKYVLHPKEKLVHTRQLDNSSRASFVSYINTCIGSKTKSIAYYMPDWSSCCTVH